MINDWIIGAEEVTRRLRAIPDGVRSNLTDSIGRLTLKLQRKVKQEKLSGQVLKVRTGTLRRSVDQSMVTDGNSIAGVVSTNVKYGKAHEYGFQGTVQQTVKEHLRRSKEQMKAAILKRKDGMSFVSKRGKKNGAILVREHTRTAQINLPERSFLRSALRDMEGEIIKSINKAVSNAAQGKG